jgi:hypothetical protein
MSKYSMDELIPLVSDLSYKYTSGESTSITYDTATQLMKAVLYCIHEYESAIDESSKTEVDFTVLSESDKKEEAKLAYHEGYQLVIIKVKKALHLYDDIMAEFKSYRNINYYDTIVKGIPSFFLYYDAKFNPQNHILTLDYFTINHLGDLCGIDVIYEYLSYIHLEQKFLRKFSEEYVIDVLAGFHSDYEELFINICSIVLRNAIGNMIARKKIMHKGFNENDFKIVKYFVSDNTREEVERKLIIILNEFINSGYNKDRQLSQYLQEDLKDFSVELINGVENNCLQRLFVL